MYNELTDIIVRIDANQDFCLKTWDEEHPEEEAEMSTMNDASTIDLGDALSYC